MNALLLAAGYGKRLLPLTLETPKCLIKINQIPLLDYWINHLINDLGFKRIFINTHYLKNKVKNFILNHKYSRSISILEEKVLRDTAGTIMDFVSFNQEEFLIAHADNLLTQSLKPFIQQALKSENNFLSVLCVKKKEIQKFGIFTIDKNNQIINFEEKPQKSISNIANGAIYYAKENFIKYCLKNPISGNFSKDVLTKIYKKVEIYNFLGQIYDIGTIDELTKIQKLIKHKKIIPWEIV